MINVIVVTFGVMCVNFVYQLFQNTPDYASAFERSFFQAVVVAAILIMVRPEA